ncbi:hypothetical protein UA08_06509 [Talaromyces atroroseus]|uniref:Uncharacterized protein n=1 Tax=Talaromyces atroroseus TaxID=1441469 RepID=A0A225AAX5_TALAT|nr:hypothetical protein UA08_06509 [Talaromyces atroroseus]OKL58161.1 hypothetical protein UA08_06509 [Talaromyces atroroseus]
MHERLGKLNRYLIAIEKGNKKIKNDSDARLFLEALCSQPNHVDCIERLLSSRNNMSCLEESFKVDMIADFVEGPATSFLKYLQDSRFENLSNGYFLRKILLIIVNPPTFWKALVKSVRGHELSQASQYSFAWLILTLLKLSNVTTDFVSVAKDLLQNQSFLLSPSSDIQQVCRKIRDTLHLKLFSGDARTGRKHDNDFENFRRISILPTADEIASVEAPFYHRADEIYEVDQDRRAAVHYDNQFRLLRQEFMTELRQELQVVLGQGKPGHPVYRIEGLQWDGMKCGHIPSNRASCVTFRCLRGLPQLSDLPEDERQAALQKNPNFLKHRALGCLLRNNDILAFGSINQATSELLSDRPVLNIEVVGRNALTKLLNQLAISWSGLFTFVVLDTPVSAYEPILSSLQQKRDSPLTEILLSPTPSPKSHKVHEAVLRFLAKKKAKSGMKIFNETGELEEASLDEYQVNALTTSLENAVSLIQGAPGTGKSFIGALLAKTIHDATPDSVLFLCRTDRALNQFLKHLMNNNIPGESLTRLGSRTTGRLKKLCLFTQGPRISDSTSTAYIGQIKSKLRELSRNIIDACNELRDKDLHLSAILDYLEFSDDSEFFDAFSIPENNSGTKLVDEDGEPITRHYLIKSWASNHDAGYFRDQVNPLHVVIWKMTGTMRQAHIDRWRQELVNDQVNQIVTISEEYTELEKELDNYLHAKVLREKRIIACTTTAAAKYTRAIHAAKPAVIIVEEAGEILESHLLALLGEDTKQLMMIGDHKQLRPRVNNHALTVEKGNGYNINVSLFERLINRGFPFAGLWNQHRMRPGISRLLSTIAYPALTDAPKTLGRPGIRGLQDQVMFINHGHHESDLPDVHERYESTSGSKRNLFEAEMVHQLVRHLGQQGYTSDEMVILTPYLGQLSILREKLSETKEPVLSNLDSSDLIQAGLLSASASATKPNKKPIRISTIDNYQGQETDIVVVSLVRGNITGDIGLMASPGRVNFMLSRARNGIILIGNRDTFLQSEMGNSTWKSLIGRLSEYGHVYDGIPVRCEQHPERNLTIRDPEGFLGIVPDGGCGV